MRLKRGVSLEKSRSNKNAEVNRRAPVARAGGGGQVVPAACRTKPRRYFDSLPSARYQLKPLPAASIDKI
jgi:hypothetical protein